jgi:hypothetical protein
MYHQLINQDYHVLISYTYLTLEKQLYPGLRNTKRDREREREREREEGRGGEAGSDNL